MSRLTTPFTNSRNALRGRTWPKSATVMRSSEEAVDEALHAEHAFDEAVAEAQHDAEHTTDG